jgi:hypothetical protein
MQMPRLKVMRTFVGALLFAGSIAIALPTAASSRTAPDKDRTHAAVAVQRVQVPLPGLRDEAAMVLVGTALIGLGAAVRRTT